MLNQNNTTQDGVAIKLWIYITEYQVQVPWSAISLLSEILFLENV
jgi:hypothetical protein